MSKDKKRGAGHGAEGVSKGKKGGVAYEVETKGVDTRKGKKRGVAYEAETDGIVIRVKPAFLEEESSPEQHRFIWAYHVEIENKGSRTFQLMTRHWRITDREGRVQEVNGSGVVGQNPVLAPGDTFEYTSGCPLSEPSGMMQGTYRLEDEEGGMLEARIPLFALDSPYDNRAAN